MAAPKAIAASIASDGTLSTDFPLTGGAVRISTEQNNHNY